MTESIVVVSTSDQYRAFAALVREYWTWLLDRYAEHPGLMDRVGSHQGVEAELSAPELIYGPPEGHVLLALRDGEVSGGVAYRDLHDGSCEMKRLFVPERCQGHGTGRRLCGSLIALASANGFGLMRLDTGYLNAEAIQMYGAMGFVGCGPHHEYPAELLPHLRFMERSLTAEISAPTV